jgi:hypothetical protein
MKSFIKSIYHGIAENCVNKGRDRSRRMKIGELRKAEFSFSQLGEDRIIDYHTYYLPPNAGFYIDVGCFHPFCYSNTFLLWKRGYRGINIDIDQNKIDLFDQARPDDTNICACISDREIEMEAFEFSDSDLNRLLPTGSFDPRSVNGVQPIGRRKCVTQRLDAIVRNSIYSDRPCILLNIDCEGLDEKVLDGANLSSLKPYLICIESHSISNRNALTERLSNEGYHLSAFLEYSSIFIKKNWINSMS